MRRALLVVLTLVGCASGARADDALAPLAPLLGCWRGEFQGQPEIYDDRCFAPMLDGAFVRDVHFVRPTTYAGETIYVYDPAANAIVLTYYAAGGGVANGRVQAALDGLIFPEHVFRRADGSELRMRSTWRFDGPDRFLVVNEAMLDGAWRNYGTIAYTRVPTVQR